MSAICGILSKQASGAFSQERLEAMRAQMGSIGPDSAFTHQRSWVLLSQQTLQIDSNQATDSAERFRNEEAEASIVFDGRLYEREIAFARLGNRLPPDTPDGRLVLELFLKDGEDALRLNGEFALAMAFDTDQTLLLARDPEGNRPLYYASNDNYFAFSSSLDALIAIPDFPKNVDRLVLAMNIARVRNPYPERTLIKAVRSLQSAHTLRVSKNGEQMNRFHRLASFIDSNRLSLSESIEGIRHHLQRAVEARMKSSFPVATNLSGGLDSSAVTALAARYGATINARIFAVSARPRIPLDPIATEEIQHMDTVAKSHSNLEHLAVFSDEYGPFRDLETFARHLDEPRWEYGHIYQQMGTAVAQRGARSLIAGMGGDHLASNRGYGCALASFPAVGIWETLRLLKLGFGKHPSVKRFLKAEILGPLAPRFVERMRALSRGGAIERRLQGCSLRKGFIESTGLKELLREHVDFALLPVRDIREAMAIEFDSGRMGSKQAQMFRRLGLENLRPYYDTRFLEFAVGLPLQHFADHPMDRGLQREAMKSILPDSVRLRTSKGAFVPSFHATARAEETKIRQLLERARQSEIAQEAIDFEKVEQAVDQTLSDQRNYNYGYWDNAIQFKIYPALSHAIALEAFR
ncbi:asparagine synthase-related protein [Pelagicoccus sp. SDUM812003]|uniref:asparagine synthetase B family protein n=1 Tax=Pelagicoccus sp. SDUM812003 TaxID=3041267 RepID=UPI00280ED17C|nr:asparagine synthase-related protein [Pelagicoccus sp. SDUM812003]MDQ8202798.1 asparagine synthase-related protein [Pelagicoccus sp. SDUM812003]